MDCCAVTPAKLACPQCDQPGRKVSHITLEAMAPGRAKEEESWRFCSTLGCDVAYYTDPRKHRVMVDAVVVQITQKRTSPDRPVCYCFGFTARQIAQDDAGDIPAKIKAGCQRGEDRCEETNPQGACCLGNVLRIARTTPQAGESAPS